MIIRSTGTAVAAMAAFCAQTSAVGDSACEYHWSSVSAQNPNGEVRSLQVHDDGSGDALYVGGRFDHIGQQSLRGIARWDGRNWSALGGGLDGPLVAVMSQLEFGGDLYVGGFFQTAGGTPAANLAMWDGENWHDIGGTNSIVYAMAAYEGELYVAGAFTMVDGVQANRIAKFNGTDWVPLGEGVMGGAVHALEVFDAGNGPELYVGGAFTAAAGQPAGGLARWNGEDWDVPPVQLTAVGASPSVRTLLSIADEANSCLYIGGFFSSANGNPASSLVRWCGDEADAMGGGMIINSNETISEGLVLDLLAMDIGHGLQPLAVGDFIGANEQPAYRVAHWDGARWRRAGEGVDDFLTSATVHAATTFNGALYIGGDFATVAGAPAPHLAVWQQAAPPVAPQAIEDLAIVGPSSVALAYDGQFDAVAASDGASETMTCWAAWSSDDESIAKITRNGHLTPVSPGTTTIRASIDEHSASMPVTIIATSQCEDDARAASCHAAHGEPGCGDAFCCEVVCRIDPYCCTDAWDEACVAIAAEHCPGYHYGEEVPLDELSYLYTLPITNHSFIWLRRYFVEEGAETITSLRSRWGDYEDKAVRFFLWSDPAQTGDPAQAKVLTCTEVTGGPWVPFPWDEVGPAIFEVAFEPTYIGPPGTSYFVGGIIDASVRVGPALTHGVHGHIDSWMTVYRDGEIDPNNLAEATFDNAGLEFALYLQPGGVSGTPPHIGDLDGNGVIDVSDLLVLLANWGPCLTGSCAADLNADGSIDVSDLLILLSNWG